MWRFFISPTIYDYIKWAKIPTYQGYVPGIAIGV